MRINVVEEVAEGRGTVEWGTVRSKHNGETLVIYVFRDAMKFDGVPALQWDFDLVEESDRWYTDDLFDGIRLPATAEQLQMIADLTGCMMLTPKIIDLIWLQAETKFNPVTNTQKYPGAPPSQRTIVATSHIHRVHEEIEEKITKAGGDVGKLIASVGKYWCLINHLRNAKDLLYGTANACNYGWPSSSGIYRGVTPGLKVWQGPGFRHDHNHWDPSQTIRLMYRKAVLFLADGSRQIVYLHDIATDPARAPLINHQGVLRYLRQLCVPAPANDVAMSMYAPTFDLVA